MNKEQIIKLLESLKKFELTHSNRAWDNSDYLEEDKYGDWVKFEDVCKLFDVAVNSCNQIEK